MLRYWYEKKLQEVCQTENAEDSARFTDRVMFASLMYFKRFFLRISFMEENPSHVMLAAFLVAGKVEEERIEPDDLLPKYAKISHEALLALELRLLEALSFQLVTVSPFRQLQGFLQDLQSASGGGVQDELQQLHSDACTFINGALCTDAPFIFTPQQLALAALQEAGAKAAPGGVDVAGWLAKRFQFLGAADGGAAAVKSEGGGGGKAKGEAEEGGVALLLAQLEAVRSSVQAATAAAPQEAADGSRLKEVDERRKRLCRAIKSAPTKVKAEAEAKAKGGPGGRSAAGAGGAAGEEAEALQTKRRKHDPDALFAVSSALLPASQPAATGLKVKPEPA